MCLAIATQKLALRAIRRSHIAGRTPWRERPTDREEAWRRTCTAARLMASGAASLSRAPSDMVNAAST